MQNEPNEQLEKAEEERIKNAFHELLRALPVFAVISAVYFLIKTLKLDYHRGVIAADAPAIIGTIIGSTIGILIIPFLVSLTFKNKVRAFVIVWLIFMLLNLGVFIHELDKIV